MEVYTSTACVTILCIIATFSAEGTGHHDTGSHSNTGFPGHIEGSECGNQSYISSGNACCNGEITNGLSQLVADCCGSVAYNSLNEICCAGSVFIRSSAHVKCCGKALYLPTTHLCCGGDKLEWKENHSCCGKDLYDTKTQICCTNHGGLLIMRKNEDCSGNQIDSDEKIEGPRQTRTPPKVPELKCGSEPYDPKNQICCSGSLYKRTALTKCCGEYHYTLFDDHVLCCNGTLHRNVPEHSECVGGVVYPPANATCLLSPRPRLGEHCCGGKIFSPSTHICCNGHSHTKTDGNFCCGSKVYDHNNRFTKCCSGHFYNLTNSKREPECCGKLLIDKNSQTCCSSSTHAILYDTKPNHHCCGHYYYNASLWSCCAEHLKPTPGHDWSHAENRLKPLMDLIPGICNKTVIFGKVESMALNASRRHIVLKVGNVIKDPWLHVSLDHCSSPALEIGMTYLWEKNHAVYKPLSISVDLISDIHLFFTACDQHKCQKGG